MMELTRREKEKADTIAGTIKHMVAQDQRIGQLEDIVQGVKDAKGIQDFKVVQLQALKMEEER